MLNHMQVHSIKVTELLMEAVSRIDKLEIAVQELTTSNEERKVQISQLTAKLEKVEVELGEKNNLISDLSRNAQLQKDKKHSVLDIVEPDCVKTLHVSKESFYTNTQTCTRGFSTLSTPPEYLLQSNSTEATVSRIQQDIEKHQTQLLRISENFQNVQQSLTQHAAVIDELRLRQDVLDVKTTNGTLVWKIPDIRRRLRDAIEGRTISLYSPPFYTSPHGYRMCIRTYLNGDGSGKGTHVSVFFVLMRSEHDSLLTYPFKQSVRFTLVNQKNPAASITEAFYPDLKSPSFNRPEKDMNIASGFPKFACQSVLQDESFTVNNMIYIKCQVDLTGLSTK